MDSLVSAHKTMVFQISLFTSVVSRKAAQEGFNIHHCCRWATTAEDFVIV